MMATGEWLLLRLSSVEGAAPSWTAVDASGALLPLDNAQGDTDLRVLAAGRQVAILVPAGDVALFNVQLPPGNEARLQQLAPFALEEQVSEDLDRLHFAVGVRDAASGLVPVAVADRQNMRQWLAAAAALSVPPRAMFAESDLAPMMPEHVTLLITPEQFILRDGRSRPVVFPADDPEFALMMLLGADKDLSQVNLVVHAAVDDWAAHEPAIEA